MSKKQQNVPARRRASFDGQISHANEPGAAQRYAFRRNRTLTGSIASRVDSAKVSSAHLKSPRMHAHDLRRHRHRLGAMLAGVVIALGGLTYLLFNFVALPKVAGLPPGAQPQDYGSYEALVQNYLKEYPADRFMFATRTERLASYMQQNGAPEVHSVDSDIRFAGIGTGTLTVNLRSPVVVWRTGDAELFVDRTGVAFSRNYGPPPNVEVVDKSGIRVSDNQVLASNRFLGFIGRVVGAMSDQGYTVTQVEIPAGVTRQVDVRLAGVGYPVKLSVDRPTGEQAEDATRAVRHMEKYAINPQYLDVRVSGKAYFRE